MSYYPREAAAQTTPLPAGLTLLQTQDHVQIGIQVRSAATFTTYTLHQPERWVLEIPSSLAAPISVPSMFLRNHPILQAILITERNTQGSNKIQRWAFVVRSIPTLAVKLKPNLIVIKFYHQAYSTPPNKALVLYASPPDSDAATPNNATPSSPSGKVPETLLKWVKSFPQRWAESPKTATLAQLAAQNETKLHEGEKATKTERESNIQWLSDAEGEKLLAQWTQDADNTFETKAFSKQEQRWDELHQQEDKLFVSLQMLALTRTGPSFLRGKSDTSQAQVPLSTAGTRLTQSLQKASPNLVRRSERLEASLREETNKVEASTQQWEARWPTQVSLYNQRVDQRLSLKRLALAKAQRQKELLQEKAKLQQKQKRLNQLEAKETAKARQQQVAKRKAQARARQAKAKTLARSKTAKAKQQKEAKALRQSEQKLAQKQEVEKKARELAQSKAKKLRRAELQKQSKALAQKQAQENNKQNQQAQAKSSQAQKAQQALAKKQAKKQALALLQRRRQVERQTRTKQQKQSKAKALRRKEAKLRQRQAKQKEKLRRKQAQAQAKRQEKALAQKRSKQTQAKAQQRAEELARRKKQREREKLNKLKSNRLVRLQRKSWEAWNKAQPFSKDPVVAWSRQKQNIADLAWKRYQAKTDARSLKIAGYRLRKSLSKDLAQDLGLAKASFRWQTQTLPARIRRTFRQKRKVSRWLWFKRRMTVYRWRIDQLRQRRRIAILREKAWMEQQRKRYAMAARQQAEARRRKKKNQKKPPTLLDIFDRLVPQKSKIQSKNP